MRADIYQKNLLAIGETNPYLADKLGKLRENVKFSAFCTKDPIDVNITEIATKMALYKRPVDDVALQIGQSEGLANYPFLVYFGIGNGVFFKALLNSSEFLKILFIIEPEIEIIFIALHVVDFSNEIRSGICKIFLAEQIDYALIREALSAEGLAAYLRLYDLKMTRPFYGKYTGDLVRINKIFINAIEHYVKSHGNCAKDALIGDEHFIANLPLMLKSASFRTLIAQKPSKTAIIVATGPSLNKQLALLKAAQNQATIIAVDASMPILEKEGIKPDLVCSIERVEATAKFFEKTSAEFHNGITFVCAALQHRKIFENIKGGQLVISMRPFHFMRQFGFHEYGYCGLGMSSANMAFDLAYLMGFETLILIGQDLAYASDGKSHAAGHVYGEDEKTADYNATLKVPAWGGSGYAITTEVWDLFRNSFITNISEVKDEMLTINATEGGSRIEGALELRFQDALDAYVFNKPLKEKIVLQSTPKGTAAILIASAKFKIDEMLKYAKKTNKEVEKLFLDVTKLCEETSELNSGGKTDEVDFKKITAIIKRIEKVKAKFHTPQFYDLFWEVVQSFILSQEMIIATIIVKPAKDDVEKKIKMIEYIYAHKQWLYMLFGAIEALTQVIKRSKSVVAKATKEGEEFLNSLAR